MKYKGMFKTKQKKSYLFETIYCLLSFSYKLKIIIVSHCIKIWKTEEFFFENDKIKSEKKIPKKPHLACWLLLVSCSSKDYLQKKGGPRGNNYNKGRLEVS